MAKKPKNLAGNEQPGGKLRELKVRFLFLIGALIVFRIGTYIPVPGVDPAALQGTTQNDIVKEYLSRGTYVFPPEPSMRLIGDMVAYTVDAIPKWNPTNICSYHLQEAGATPVQEIAYSMATALAVLDTARARVDLPGEALPRVVPLEYLAHTLGSGSPMISR